jgi:hypothetical protein
VAGLNNSKRRSTALVESYLRQGKDRYADQKFLRLHIWPRIRCASLAHDRFLKLAETRRPPRHPTEADTHIGMAWPRRDRKPGAEELR